MNSSAEAEGAGLDIAKLAAAALLLVGGIFAFYYFAEWSALLRVIGLLAIAGVAVAVAFQTHQGRQLWQLFADARMEVRKVVWPTRRKPSRRPWLSWRWSWCWVSFCGCST